MLNKNDFVEIEYTGWTKQDNIIFDTTDEKTAKAEGIHNPQVRYGPVVICLSQGQTIKGIEKQLEGKDLGKEYNFEIQPEDAFGKKDAKLIQLISTAKFKKADINPIPGMQVNIDDQMGIIKTVSGGRTLVDFNHPLSGKEVVYKVKTIKLIDDLTKKISILVGAMLQIEEPEIEINDNKAEVKLAFDLPPEVVDVLKKKILEVVEIKELTFKKIEKKEKEASKEKIKTDITPNKVNSNTENSKE
jgi:FKBP-type peptidyl-prolyl cis-trans isomerase 2